MRTLPAELIAAQKTASAVPYVPVTIENRIGAVRRYDYTMLDATANAITKHDVCVVADGTVMRVRIESGAVKLMRVTNPASGPWTTWTNLVTGMGAQVACAAKGTRVIVVYSDAAGTGVRYRESTDSGATFGGDTALVTAAGAITDLAVAYKNTSGDLLIAWAMASALAVNRRVGGAFGGAVTWPHAASSLNGVAVAFNLDYEIVLTGAETVSGRPSVWSVIYGDSGSVVSGTWSSLDAQVQAEATAQTEFRAPSITATDTYRINFTEVATYTGGVTRAYRTWLHPLLPYNHGRFSWRTPLPVDYAGAQGLAAAANATVTGGFIYESAPDRIQRAPRDVVVLDVSANVLSIELREDTGNARATIDLNNDAGQYAGPASPLQLGNGVSLGFGYQTTAGAFAGSMLDLWIAAYEHRRDGGRSTLRLHLESGWDLLRRSHQRTQIVHTTDHYGGILSAILARAGLTMATNGASTRAVSITPAFTIHAQTSGYDAARQTLSFVADRLFMRVDAGSLFTERVAGEAASYTFGGAHQLSAIELRSEPAPVAEAQAFGAGAFGQSTDYALATHGLAPQEQQRDATSTSGAAAAATAATRIRARKLDEDAGSIVVPPHCGLELLDVIAFDDPYVNPATIPRRVMGITWRYDKRRAKYEQTVRLGPV